MRALGWMVMAGLAACLGEGPTLPALVDAPGSDTPPGPPCTGDIFDPCSMNSDCMSMNCRLYRGDGWAVCTTTCTPGMNATCPTQSGVEARCNNMGFCKPVAPNHCSR